jgi:hypothetical protein
MLHEEMYDCTDDEVLEYYTVESTLSDFFRPVFCGDRKLTGYPPSPPEFYGNITLCHCPYS